MKLTMKHRTARSSLHSNKRCWLSFILIISLLASSSLLVSVVLLQHNHSSYSPGDETTKLSQVLKSFSSPSSASLAAETTSSVDYFSCCGLGHRMSKMSDAAYVASTLNYGLRVHWAFCKKVEVFHHFFGSQPISELKNVTSKNQVVTFSNELPGFKKFKRTANTDDCACQNQQEFFQISGTFHESLRHRFLHSHKVNQFLLAENWEQHTVIGLHIRAGNGEIGDFSRKNRGIHDLEAWTRNMANLVWKMWVNEWSILETNSGKPPMLFLATDTASVIQDFQFHLQGKIKVLAYDQLRSGNGTGVAFGNKIQTEGDCLLNWNNSILDMMILSHAHVVIAGRPSSFTQSLPMSTMFQTQERRISNNYCEVNRNATLHQCFDSIMDWCCHGTTAFHLEGVATQYEYRRLPLTLQEQKLQEHQRIRPPMPQLKNHVSTGTRKAKMNMHRTFLPYDLSNFIE